MTLANWSGAYLYAQEVNEHTEKNTPSLEDFPFIIINNVQDSIQELIIQDSTFHRISTSVNFKVNKTNIDTTAQFFTSWKQIVPQLTDENYRLQQMFLRGAASPEGPYENNKRLAHARAMNLFKMIKKDLPNVDSLNINFSFINEDYGYLILLMKKAADPETHIVEHIFEENNGLEPAIKRQLLNYNGGILWLRLLKTYYPQLRSARLVLQFVKNQKPEPVVPVDTLPEVIPEEIVPDSIPADSIPASVDSTSTANDTTLIRRKVLAIRTNLLYDAWYQSQFGWAPGMNVQLEYYPKEGHITYNAGFTFHNHRHWGDNEFFQARDIDLEARWYFSPSGTFVGPFAGIDLHGSWYGIGLSKTKGWEGEGGGAGITLGWSHYISRNHRWRFDANIGLGYFVTRYDPYVYGNTMTGEIDGKYYYDYYGNLSEFRRRNHRLQWLGPTQAGIHITYVILHRRIQRKGVGFRRTEKAPLPYPAEQKGDEQ